MSDLQSENEAVPAPVETEAETPATVEAPSEPLSDPKPEQAEPATTDAPVDPDETHESILSELLGELEGITAMAKSEIHAVIDRARGKFIKL